MVFFKKNTRFISGAREMIQTLIELFTFAEDLVSFSAATRQFTMVLTSNSREASSNFWPHTVPLHTYRRYTCIHKIKIK